MGVTVLITGGCGFIGSSVVLLFREERPDWRIVNVDKLTYAGNRMSLASLSEDQGYRFVQGDVADRQLIYDLFEQEKPDFVVHLAAESHVDRSILDPAPFLDTNVIGSQVLFEAARHFNPETFVHVSTDEVYGGLGANDPPRSEDSPLQPSNPYSASKAAADLMAQAYHRTYGFHVILLRPCNNYGPRQFPEKLIPLFIRNMLSGRKLPVYGDGAQRRDWLHVEDGARAVLATLENGAPGRTYNAAAGEERANSEVVEALCKAVAKHVGVPPKSLMATVENVADRPGHDLRYAIDDRRIREETGWTPKIPFQKGIQRTVDWYLNNRAWLDKADASEYQEYYTTSCRRSSGQT